VQNHVFQIHDLSQFLEMVLDVMASPNVIGCINSSLEGMFIKAGRRPCCSQQSKKPTKTTLVLARPPLRSSDAQKWPTKQTGAHVDFIKSLCLRSSYYVTCHLCSARRVPPLWPFFAISLLQPTECFHRQLSCTRFGRHIVLAQRLAIVYVSGGCRHKS